MSKEEEISKLKNVLDNVGLNYFETIEKYPHEFSGGQDRELQLPEH